MASRGVVNRLGIVTDKEYEYAGNDFEDASELVGVGSNHSLPGYSHTPNRIYVKTDANGFREMRVYGEDGKVKLEIGYHPERNLDSSGCRVLHYHEYDENLDRSLAKLMTSEIYEKYKKYINHWKVFYEKK